MVSIPLLYKGEKLNNLLRKEWFKLCEDFVSNEIVHIDKELVNRSTGSRAILVESYIGHRTNLEVLCRLTCRHNHFEDYRIVLKNLADLKGCSAANGQGARKMERPILINPANFEGHLVFVLIRELVQNVDRMAGADLASIVRIEGLQMMNQIKCSCWELRQDCLIDPNPFLESSFLQVEGGFGQIDGKINSTRRAGSSDLRKPPYQIVENGSQFGDAATNRNTQINRNPTKHYESVANYLVDSFWLFLADYSIRFATKETSGFQFEILNVAPCCPDSGSNL